MLIGPFIRLDSSRTDANWPTPSVVPTHVLTCDNGHDVTLRGAHSNQWNDPLEALRWMSMNFPAAGRWVGYLSYDLGRQFETLPSVAADDLKLPLFRFAFLPSDGKPHEMPPATVAPSASDSTITSTLPHDRYLLAARRCIDYIAAGDVFQINLAQRLCVPTKKPAAAIYRALLENAPAGYGGLLDFGDFALICNSPELFFRITPDRTITTRPIKGTRPRGPGQLEALRDSEKDQAELNMIVDLERNDLGRICRLGSVIVSQRRTIETHPTVYHGAATIQGQLRSEVDFVAVLAAMFPGGSITGTPKIRAMQIIDSLETVRRGPYCGAIGYLDHDGRIEFNIAIRTMMLKNNVAYIPVGGGIVADSQPQAEYDETLTKARALLGALDIGHDRLRR